MKNVTWIILYFLFASQTHADVPARQRDEIVYLLNFIKNTNCIMERNGKKHRGEEAYSHILKKYHYFRNKIKSTEQFIELSASKSTLSGKPYMVSCDGQKSIGTQKWLLDELHNYRRNRNKGPLTYQWSRTAKQLRCSQPLSSRVSDIDMSRELSFQPSKAPP